LFAEKIEEDAMLKGDVVSATRIPSESILFNIDQQANNNHDDAPPSQFFYKPDHPTILISSSYLVDIFDFSEQYGFIRKEDYRQAAALVRSEGHDKQFY
jgi:hypothetical protein